MLLRAAILFFVLTASTFAGELKVKVVQITDGDTVGVVDAEKKYFKVRLAGIDSPEKKQAFHDKAKEALAGKVFEKDVILDEQGKDKYGRVLGTLKIGDRNVNRELVSEGWSWWYQKYAPNDTALKQAEAEARKKKAGLWADAAPVAPWDFRAKKPAGTSK